MNRSDLVSNIAAQSGLTKKDVDTVLGGVINEISAALKSGDKVQLAGLGTFETRSRSARSGRNPQTGKTIEIAASTVPAFKAAKALKDAVK